MAPSQPSPARLGELCSSTALPWSGGSCPFPKMEGQRWVGGGPTCTIAETSPAARTETWWPGATFEGLAANKSLRPTRIDDQNTEAGCGMVEEPQIQHSHSWTRGTQCLVFNGTASCSHPFTDGPFLPQGCTDPQLGKSQCVPA